MTVNASPSCALRSMSDDYKEAGEIFVELVTWSTGRSIWLSAQMIQAAHSLIRFSSTGYCIYISIEVGPNLNDSAIFPNPINRWLSTVFDRPILIIRNSKNDRSNGKRSINDFRHRQKSHNNKCTRIRCNGKILDKHIIIGGFMTQLCP